MAIPEQFLSDRIRRLEKSVALKTIIYKCNNRLAGQFTSYLLTSMLYNQIFVSFKKISKI